MAQDSGKPLAAMKRMLCLLTFLFVAGVTPCFALMELATVSKEEAKELGVRIEVTGNGPNELWVKMEFKAEGRFKDFQHVSLEIGDGDKLLIGYTPLRDDRSTPGKVTVQFMASRSYVEKVTLRIVTGFPGNYAGHDLRLKEFVEPQIREARGAGGEGKR